MVSVMTSGTRCTSSGELTTLRRGSTIAHMLLVGRTPILVEPMHFSLKLSSIDGSGALWFGCIAVKIA